MRWMLGLLALIAVAVPAAPAGAASPVTGFYAGPVADGSPCNATGDGVVPAVRASVNTDFCVAYRTLSTPQAAIEEDDLERMVIDTPLGFAANAAAIPTCPLTGAGGFNPDDTEDVGCDAASQVGNATAGIRSIVRAPSGTQIPIRVPVVPGRVYNLTPGDREVALLGIVIDPRVIIDQPKVKVVVRVTLRPAPEVGLRSVIENLPQQVSVVPPVGGDVQRQPVAIDQFSLTFWGARSAHPSMPADFAFVGSDCATDQRTSLRAVSYDGTPTSADATPYRLTGCDDPAIPFAPSLEVRTDDRRADVTTRSEVIARFGQSQTPGVVASTVRSTVVTLPAGLALSAQLASGSAGLRLCTEAAFGPTSAAPSACPAGAAVGTVRIASPALRRPLTGEAFLGPQPSPGALPSLFVEAQLADGEDAPRVKLTGTLTLDASNRIVATLTGLPQLPVSEFALTFRGGDQSVLVTAEQCGTTTGTLAAEPEARPGASVDASADYTVDADCGPRGFAPVVGFRLDDAASAGRSSPLNVELGRADRTERIASTSINLPPGMLANLKGVPECELGAAAAGACPAASRVGSLTALAGVGPAPLAVPGDVFLTARRGSAVAGLAFRVPVVLGDLDLGVLNVPGDVVIRPTDQGLRVDAVLPERFKGIPLNLRNLSIRLDRPGFALSPTSCGPLTTSSPMTSTGGSTAAPTATLQVSGCDALPFAPSMETAVSGPTTPGSQPFTQVRVETPAGSSALRQAFVTLPEGLGFDLKQVARACSVDDFTASRCPSVASIGKVYGSLSITDEPLEGQLYLLRPATGEVLPGIGLAFEGRFAANIAGQTRIDQRTGQLVSVFPTIPDLPLTSFQIDVAGGKTGVLVATKVLCAGPGVGFRAVFVGSTGTNASRTSSSACGVRLGEGSPKVSGRMEGLRGGKPRLALRVSAPSQRGAVAKRIRSVDLTVPSSWLISTSRAKRSSGIALQGLSGEGRATSRKASKTKLRLTMPREGTTAVTIRTRSRTLTTRTKSARTVKRDVAIGVTVRYTDGTSASTSASLKPR